MTQRIDVLVSRLHPHVSPRPVRRAAFSLVGIALAFGIALAPGFATGLAPGSAFGAEDPPLAAEAKAKKQASPVFYLRDRSKITGMPRFEVLTVETKYGPLSVPRDQLLRVRFARRIATELREKIDKCVAELASEDFDAREAATAGLRELGSIALEALRKAAKSSNDEVKSRAASLIAEINDKMSSDPAQEDDSFPQLGGSEDEIATLRMTVKGRIPIDEFVVDSQYGELTVSVSDLSGISFRNAMPTSVKVDVTAQNTPPSNWVDTKVELEKGQKIKIDASGQITVRNYGIVSGPQGNTDWSGHATFGNFPMLSLVGKVGKKGQPFLVGASYKGQAKAQGRLYLSIVTFTPYPSGAAGNYQAKVNVGTTD